MLAFSGIFFGDVEYAAVVETISGGQGMTTRGDDRPILR
jgi:hypothetical protein